MKNISIGLISAMPQEIGVIKDHLSNIQFEYFGDLTIYKGNYNFLDDINLEITFAWSGWGKVSASRTTTRVISSDLNSKNLDFLIFTGVAGGAKDFLSQWDLVVGNFLIQHDMDASPLYQKYQIPSTRDIYMRPDKKLFDWTLNSMRKFIKSEKNIKFKNVFQGVIASGDKFINDEYILNSLKNNISDLHAIEMEGAAFAQVAIQEKIKWIVLRTISDNAKSEANQTFEKFIEQYSEYSWDLLDSLFINLDTYTD